MIFRLILPQWAIEEHPNRRRVLEGEFNEDQIEKYNILFYNTYFLPNYPSEYNAKSPVSGSDIDVFRFVFCDMDLKENKWENKSVFVDTLLNSEAVPTFIVDSGNGVHAYWQVSDLDPMSYLKLQRRLSTHFKTDEAVGQIYQLMRVPGTINTKNRDDFKLCYELHRTENIYSCEDLDKILPNITKEDEEYCKQHFDKTYKLIPETKIDDTVPVKFSHLLRNNQEVKNIWSGNVEDRSKGDFRVGHIMFASGFTKEEAASVLVNSAKALQRAPAHRVSYALNIIDKIWTFEDKSTSEITPLSNSVRNILARGENVIAGTRFPCNKLLDDTVTGFRLGHVIGLVAGSGVGKTAMAINMFKWFTENNPDYDHFFVSLEQTDNEIAGRWRTVCQGDERLHDKVHVLSNYNEDHVFRHLSLDDIKTYILEYQKKNDRKIGTVVIDHIGALRKQNKNGENQALVDICHQMKSFAIETNTLVIMQSQAPREKAGIGDLELSKDAAYGTVFFESYVDWMLAIWQPLKRAYAEGAPTIMAFKYCKIRHKKQGQDSIQEDVCYRLMFDPETEKLRELTQAEETSCDFYQNKCVNIRKKDRKTELVPYKSRRVVDGKVDSDKDPRTA